MPRRGPATLSKDGRRRLTFYVETRLDLFQIETLIYHTTVGITVGEDPGRGRLEKALKQTLWMHGMDVLSWDMFETDDGDFDRGWEARLEWAKSLAAKYYAPLFADDVDTVIGTR